MIKGFESYSGRYGMVLSKKASETNQVCDNGLLFTSEALVLLARNNLLQTIGEYRLFFINLLESCQVEKGLYKRSPEHDMQQGPDDIIGIAVASKYLKTDHASRILNYLRHNNFTYYTAVNKLFWSGWLGRQPGLTALLSMCAGETPNLYDRLILMVGILFTCFEKKEETSNRLLAQMIIYGLDDHWTSTLCRSIWLIHLHYYGGIKLAAETYFGDDHPIVYLF